MIVYEFNGKKECNNLIELQEVLKHRSKGNSNAADAGAAEILGKLDCLLD